METEDEEIIEEDSVDEEDQSEVEAESGSTGCSEEEKEYIESDAVVSHEQYQKNILKLINDKAEFQFSINYKLYPDLIPYFWASVNQYCQELMELFIISDGWRLTDFLKAAETQKLHSLFRCGYTNKGTIEQKAKHFQLTFQILLDAAKFQWLAPWKTKNTFGLSICMKRQIGGMFLSYYLLTKQPEPPQGVLSTLKRKMHLDADDSRGVRFFLNDVDKLEDGGNGKILKKEIKLIFLKLHHLGLFEKTMLKDDYCLEAPTLLLAGFKADPHLNYFGLLKDVRDKLLYLTFQGIGNTTFKEMLKVAQTLVNKGKKNTKSKCKGNNSTQANSCTNTSTNQRQAPVTFQTKLRQRLDQQFQTFQQQHAMPSVVEVEPEPPSSKKSKSRSNPSLNKNPKSTPPSSSKKPTPTTKNASTFPPARKTEWTVEDVQALKQERDLAVIAFRIIEILRFVTPANPMTTSRLINELRVDQTSKDLINKYAARGKVSHDNRLNCPSRLARLSKRGKHQCFNTTGTNSWMNYISDSKKQSKTLTHAEMLEKLKTHTVVAIEPSLIFKPLSHPDTFVDGNEEFGFDDLNVDGAWSTDENESLLQEGVGEDSENATVTTKPTSPKKNQELRDMPDLNRFWEKDEDSISSTASLTSSHDQPPRLSPMIQHDDPLQDTPPSSVVSSITCGRDPLSISSMQQVDSPSSSSPNTRPWLILVADETRGPNLPSTSKGLLTTDAKGDEPRKFLSMPTISNLSLSTSSKNSEQSTSKCDTRIVSARASKQSSKDSVDTATTITSCRRSLRSSKNK